VTPPGGIWPGGAAYVDGTFCPIAEASVPILDWGFVRSDATYDVVAVWKGRFFRLEDHLDRFERSVASLRMTLPVDRAALKAILADCVTRAGLDDAYVSMTLTRGVPPAGSRDPRQFRNRLYAFAVPYARVFDPAARGRAARIALIDRMRIPPQSVDPRVKNYHWLDLIMSHIEALESGADFPVLTDGAGHVTEGPGFNLFAVIGGRVVTPETGVLEGITRQTAIDICRDLQIRTEVRALSIDELRRADEIFVTSTAGGIMPIGWLDGTSLHSPAPGPITQRLHDAYWTAHESGAWTTAVGACHAGSAN
jgi:branched-chain amino acid aminotransferase